MWFSYIYTWDSLFLAVEQPDSLEVIEAGHHVLLRLGHGLLVELLGHHGKEPALLEVAGTVHPGAEVLPLEVLVHPGLGPGVPRVPMVIHLLLPGQVAEHRHRLSQREVPVLEHRHLLQGVHLGVLLRLGVTGRDANLCNNLKILITTIMMVLTLTSSCLMLAARQKMVTALAGWDIRSANTLRLMMEQESDLYSMTCHSVSLIHFQIQASSTMFIFTNIY